MAKRGRASVAEMSTAAILSPIGASDRLVAPAHLSDAELGVWAEVVNDQPADAFSATHVPLLEMYCRHVVQSRVIADEILNFQREWLANDDGLKRYDRLLAMQEREGRAASSLATRLRLTRQAVEHPRTTMRALANKPKSRKPWELPDSGE
jgi:hypothetical protein